MIMTTENLLAAVLLVVVFAVIVGGKKLSSIQEYLRYLAQQERDRQETKHAKDSMDRFSKEMQQRN